MLTISISAEAYRAITATPEGSKAEARPAAVGGFYVTLPHGVLDRLKKLRGPGREV